MQQVDQANGTLECDGMECQQCFFARLSFDVFEDLLFIVDQEIAVLVLGNVYVRHVAVSPLFSQ
ncbi:hypothetical protein D3C76_1721310 [compost metagenome]